MHPPDLNPAEAGELFNNRLEATPSMDGRVGTQLSQPTDVQAARSYFQTSGGQAQLPDLRIDASMGAESSLSNGSGFGNEFNSLTGAESSLNTMPGLESSAMPGLDLVPGLEQGALAAGGEPISPLVQMILKMPGLTGIIGDFFSALMAFFFPSDGGLLATLLDPTLWAAAAQHAFTSVAQVLMHDLPLTLTTFGSNNPFQTLLQNGLMESGTKAASAASPVTLSLEHQPFDLNSLNVGGNLGPGQSLYEMNSMDGSQFLDGGAANIDLSSNKFIAMEGGNSFGPTLGSSNVPTAQMQTSTTFPQTQPAPTAQAPSGMQPADAQAVSERGSLINDGTTGGGTEIASSTPAHHLVQPGDNLWNIAKEHLGSGTRWSDIYDLNKDLIGNNPDLIYSGTDLKLPGGAEHIASDSSNYVVKSGDNLWNIARDHMGGGQNWHSIYDQNAGLVGSNPNLIHPGQNLAIPDGGSHIQVAHGSGAHSTQAASTSHSATAGHHNGNTAHSAHHARTTHHGDSQPHHVAHAKPATVHSADTSVSANSEAVQTQTAESAAATKADNSLNIEEIGKTAHAPDDWKQEIGLKAIAKSL